MRFKQHFRVLHHVLLIEERCTRTRVRWCRQAYGVPLHRPPALVSREEVEEEKARLRAIDARPIKKVAEAKQRKRKRLQARRAPNPQSVALEPNWLQPCVVCLMRCFPVGSMGGEEARPAWCLDCEQSHLRGG